ncbi:MAG: ABC transporter ATP-binding protein [Rhodospirillales bacterium]|nr:ABC transporter ATP-binding protein [Rhodospirillales bacterium]
MATAHPAPFLTSPRSFLAHYLALRPLQFTGVVLLILSAAACAVAVQYGMKLLVDAMAAGEEGHGRVWQALAFFITLIAVENALWRLAGWLGCRTLVGTGVDIRRELFAHLSGHPMRYFAEHLSGALGNRITGTAGAFGAALGILLWNVIPPCTDFVGALIIFSGLDWRMAAALALLVMCVAAWLAWFGAKGRPLHNAYAEQANIVSGELVDVVGNIWAVKAFSARTRELARLTKKFEAEAVAQRRSWMWLEKTRTLHDIALTLMAGSMLLWAIWLWTNSRITPGDVVVVSALTFRILHGSRDLVLALVNTTQHWHYIGETLRTIGKPHEIVDMPDATSHIGLGGAVTFEDVTFGYGEGRPVLRRFSLDIPPGQHVGIVGPSGAGKSTILALLQRLHDVDGGRILIDGQPITRLTQDSLRAAIAVVPQEISLFHRSVMENIRYGNPAATDEEVYASARAAHCDAFIRELPHGYDTLVGERGVKLSGGQRQRIGIARAILKNAPIIVLDEATSALDSDSERDIQHALEALVRGRTVIAIAHRLSTLVSFDRIVVIEDGRIVEDGSPQELRRRRGAFDRLWRLQADGLSMEAPVESSVQD